MAQSGIYWFKSLSGISQRLSVMAQEFDGLADEVVTETSKVGAQTILDIINRSQQSDGIITGAPAVVSGDMRAAIGYTPAQQTAKGRSAGSFGYIHGDADYFVFKEDGTFTMIPMHSMAQGVVAAQTALDDQLAKAGAEIKTYWQDVFK